MVNPFLKYVEPEEPNPFLKYVQPEEPKLEEQKAETGFIPSIKRGAAQTGVLLGDILPSMVGRAVGADEYAAQQMQEAAQSQEEIAKKYPGRNIEIDVSEDGENGSHAVYNKQPVPKQII